MLLSSQFSREVASSVQLFTNHPQILSPLIEIFVILAVAREFQQNNIGITLYLRNSGFVYFSLHKCLFYLVSPWPEIVSALMLSSSILCSVLLLLFCGDLQGWRKKREKTAANSSYVASFFLFLLTFSH